MDICFSMCMCKREIKLGINSVCPSDMDYGPRLLMGIHLLTLHWKKCVRACSARQKWTCGHNSWKDLTAGNSGDQICHLWGIWGHNAKIFAIWGWQQQLQQWICNLPWYKCVRIFWEPKKTRKMLLKIPDIANLILHLVPATVFPSKG